MTQTTEQLIETLARSGEAVAPMRPPLQLIVRLGGVLIAYALITQEVLGLRADLLAQLMRPFFTAEILLLVTVTLSSLFASVHLAFPDQYQHPGIVKIPAYAFGTFVLLLLVQAFLPADARMVIPVGEHIHGMECTFCIASVAMIPAAIMIFFLRKGASAYPFLSGAYAVLAATCIGCLTLRLSEANDSLAHLVTWHYLPTLAFAAFGAMIGRIFLKW